VPLAQARAFQSSSVLVKEVAEAALYCAHRTSTVSPCAFREQEGHLAALYPLRYFIFKGSLVDPRLRASNEIHAPSKLARYLSGMGAD
jgi:hypothetical protein